MRGWAFAAKQRAKTIENKERIRFIRSSYFRRRYEKNKTFAPSERILSIGWGEL